MVYMLMSYSSAEDCTTLARDNYIQKTLQTFEEEEEELDDRTCTEYVIKYLDDMCGWIPDPTIQYRRNGRDVRTGGKTSQKNQGKQGRTDWGSLARRTGRNDNQSSTLTEYEFKHYTNLKKYIEQYRRFHTCGGPLEKLSQSAYGRTKTVYYKNESGASDKPATQQSKSAESAEERRPQTQHHLPDAPRGGLVRNYEEPPPATAPRYHSLTDSVLRKRTMSSQQLIGNYTNNGWSNIPPGVVHGEPPPQKPTNTNKETPMQWTINEHGLTIYHEKSPSHSVFRHRKSDADAISASPFAAYAPTQGSFLPFFTPSQQVVAATAGLSQQKRKQLNDASPSPPNLPNNLPVSSGFSIDRTIGNKNSTTGVTPNKNKSFRDFYSQLVHAAVNLQLTKNKKASVESMTQEAATEQIQLEPSETKPTTHQQQIQT